MKCKVYCYQVTVSGLFGRNRKVKSHTFDVVKDSPVQLTREEAIARLLDFLPTVKVRSRCYFRFWESPETLEETDGMLIRSFEISLGRSVSLLKGYTSDGIAVEEVA